MYSYENLLEDICSIDAVSVESIGISCGGRAIPVIHAGSKKGKQLIICGAIHAREHITAKLTVLMLQHCLQNPETMCGGGIYFIPMANPDGVNLCVKGIDSVKSLWDRKNLLKLNRCSPDFSLWKANLSGVDLNVNFDARFGSGISNKFEPAPENYVGQCPFSEPETRALRDFTLKVKPSAVLSYHCKGEIIYWKFHQSGNLLRDRILADIISAETGYKLVDESGSAGGYKDWCIEHLQIPSFTIEVGNDDYGHPFPYSELCGIFEQNKNLPKLLLENLM